jgi:ABC-type phosphate transport system auxiliary subunit
MDFCRATAFFNLLVSMRKRLFLLLFIPLCFRVSAQTTATPSTAATDSQLAALIGQRSKLYKDWDYYQQQNHALFGGKSKNDLRDIIATLERIIAKDNQILARLQTVNAKERERLELQALRLQTKTGSLTNQTNSFLNETNEMAERVQRLEARLKAEKEQRKAAEARIESTFQIASAIVVGVVLLAYLAWRRARRVAR